VSKGVQRLPLLYLTVRRKKKFAPCCKLAYPDDIVKAKGLTAARTQANLYRWAQR
jgi:hypothetical protein